MGSLSISPVSKQTIENNNNKLLLPRKPARQPNPVVYRKLRRGSASTRIPGKQIELSTNKELLRKTARLTNATQPNKALPYYKAYINDEDEDEEWIKESDEEHHSVLHDKKGNQEPERSIQKSSKNSSQILTEKQKKKSSHIDIANKVRSSSHVIHVKEMTETLDCDQGSTEKLCRSASTCEAFVQFCSTEVICPQEYRAALAGKLYGVQAALLSALGNPFENLSQSMSPKNNSHILVLSLGQASTGFLPAMIWTGMFIISFVYTVTVVWSLDFRVPIISMLCLALLYCLSVLVAAASGFNVLCGTFRMNGILFASLGVFSFVLLLFVLVMLVLFVSWRRTNQDGRAK